MIRKKRIILLMASIVLLGLIAAGAPAFLRFLGHSLIHETPFEKADVAIVLSGGSGERVENAVLLYKSKKIEKMIMTGNPCYGKSEAFFMAEYARALGVPNEAILLEEKAVSTYENATRTAPICAKNHFRSAVIVTSKFHTDRAYKTFKKVYKNNITLYCVAADDKINYDAWWRDTEMAESILIELGKTFFYYTNLQRK